MSPGETGPPDCGRGAAPLEAARAPAPNSAPARQKTFILDMRFTSLASSTFADVKALVSPALIYRFPGCCLMSSTKRLMSIFRFFHNADKRRAAERSVIMDGEIQRLAAALDRDVLAVRLPGAVLDFSHHGHVRLSSRPEVEHHHPAGIAVRSFELAPARGVREAKADQHHGEEHVLKKCARHEILLNFGSWRPSPGDLRRMFLPGSRSSLDRHAHALRRAWHHRFTLPCVPFR